MAISNAEKQARFRKKEELNKYVHRVFLECQLAVQSTSCQLTAADVQAQLEKAAELPNGWTDEDFDRAVRRVENVKLDVYGTGDPVGVDVTEGRNADKEFMTTPNPRKWMEDMDKAKKDTLALASHLISAMEISQLPTEDCAAAVMEAQRYIGRVLVNSTSEGQSDAMAVCLASVNPHYERPDWFIERYAEWLRYRLDSESLKTLGKRLQKLAGEF